MNTATSHKQSSPYFAPLWKTLFNKIKTFLAYINILILKAQNPDSEKYIDGVLAFRRQHADALLERVNKYILNIDGKSPEEIHGSFLIANKEWHQYVQRVNRLNKKHQLLPDGFFNMVTSRTREYVEAQRSQAVFKKKAGVPKMKNPPLPPENNLKIER